jgi:MoxR-like ATPase
MNDWYIYTGDNPSDKKIDKLPSAPKWRQFKSRFDQANFQDTPIAPKEQSWDEIRGMTFEAGDEEKRMVNAALYLRRPLLITGNPGIGKSSLAYSVAYELKLGKVLYWPITTKSTIQDGLYQYDAIGRLQDIQIERLKKQVGNIEPPDIGQYIRLGPLGTAFIASKRPRVLLIDEIDKSDIDLPNDLLNIFEEGSFEIPELSRIQQKQEQVFVFSHDDRDCEKVPVYKGRVVCNEFPLILLTSNAERELPAPFLRRCLRLDIAEPNLDKLKKIVESHFGEKEKNENKELIETFFDLRQKGSLSTDQLLNAIYMTTKGVDLSGKNKDIESLRDAIFKYLSTMGNL